MRKHLLLTIALLCAVVQGAWADNVNYIECSWSGGNTDGHVVSTEKTCANPTLWDGTSNLTGGWYYFSGSLETNTSRIQVTGNSKLILVDGCHLKHKRGIYIKDGCTLTIYAQSGGTGKLECPSADGDNAAIGGNADAVGGSLVIHGGTIIAKADHNNASGIGGGNHKSGMRSVVIYGGNVTANGKSSGAGIGCGQQNADPPTVTIYGGTVIAKGGDFGAGIGGGEDCGNGTVKIYGGNITATGNMDSAGIGGGECGDQDNPVYIYGGNIYATGASGAAIGGGYKGSGGEVHILGGTVKCVSLGGGCAIGAGENGSSNGSLELASNLCVKNDKNSGSLVSSSQRISTCQTAYGQCTIQVCSHSGGKTYTDKDIYYHHVNCTGDYCEGEDEHHTKGNDNKCTQCGRELAGHTYTFYEANETGEGYASPGTDYYVTELNEFTFPDYSSLPYKMTFVGWEQSDVVPDNLIAESTDGLIEAESVITVPVESGDCNYYARYKNVYFSGGSGTQSAPFLISDEDDWNRLADAVKNGISFNGMYFQLTDDISVTTMVGQGDNRFRGKFDGQGHTITVDYTSITEDYCAPFRHISGATIKNLYVDGTIETSGCYAAGIVAYTRYYSKIENCRSSVTIRSSHAGWAGHGGILGLKAEVTQSEPTIEGCVFKGKILTTGEPATTGGAGIVGYTNGQTLTIKNCLYKPATLGTGETAVACATIYENASSSGTHPVTTVTCTDCFYTEVIGSVQGGTQGYTVESGTEGLTLDYGSATTTYEYDGIKAYSFDQGNETTLGGLLYGDKLYTGGTTKVTFTPEADKAVTNLQVVDADNTSSVLSVPTANTDGTYTLTMPSKNVKVTSNLNPYKIELQNALANTTTITANDDRIADVTITGRTLFKDGSWNTLCLPFDVSAAQIAISDHPLNGATIMELDTEGTYDTDKQTGFDGETLYLYFKNATAIEAGVPYLVKWTTTGSDILSPKFPYSEIEGYDPEAIESNDGKVNFVGNYDPVPLTAGQGTYYLGADNKLYYPSTGRTMNAFRAYFQVDLGNGGPSAVRAFVLNFGGNETTGIISTTNFTDYTDKAGAGWYDLQGRKLAKKPSQKGLYIHNGRKIVIN